MPEQANPPKFSRSAYKRGPLVIHARTDEGVSACNKNLDVHDSHVPAERVGPEYICLRQPCNRLWREEIERLDQEEETT